MPRSTETFILHDDEEDVFKKFSSGTGVTPEMLCYTRGMSKSTPKETSLRTMRLIAHAAWADAHERGQTRNGRLLARGGRHQDRKLHDKRMACRKGQHQE